MELMVASINYQDVFMLLETFEKGLNVIGYIPVVGSMSAVVRNHYAKIEAVAGIVFAAFAIGIHLQGNPSRAYFIIGGTLLGHSLLNEGRSLIEMVPGLPLITTLPYDVLSTMYLGRRFFSYV
jgi:hypothetical protein